MTFKEIKINTGFDFMKIVDKRVKSAALKYLISKVKSKGKVQ